MASPNILPRDSGFTLLEVLISLVILVIIFSLGLFVSFDFYRSYAGESEKNIVVSTLQKARSQAMDNIGQNRHGVHVQGNPLQYIMFECAPPCNSYPGTSASDTIISASYNISLTPTPPFDIIFDQLSGDCVPSPTFDCASDNPITINGNTTSYIITINHEGQISW